MSVELNNKKVINSWAMYDWANSVFSLTIATAIFPPYYESVSKAAAIASGSAINGPYYIDFLGMKIVNAALYSYALSIGFLLVTFFSPILSGIADARRNKKSFLKMFCYMGSTSCMLMYFFNPSTVHIGIILFIISLFGFGGSIVFYNAFLPEIASEDQFDRVSARGFSMGYIGSVILLIANLVTIMFPEWFFPVQSKANELLNASPSLNAASALSEAKDYYVGVASRLAFVSVGIWWAGFAQITFKNLPEEAPEKKYEGNVFTKGFQEIKKVWIEIQSNVEHGKIRRYLWGFFFVSMGLQTVLYVASLFGSQELHLPTQDLIITILIIQLIAILGAWVFSRVSAKLGNIHTLIIMIIVWIIICGIAYKITTAAEFYTLGALVGIVMGGIQSMFRSTYAKLIPTTTKDHASYFSFYDVCEKLAIVIGTFSFGMLLDITGNMRASVLALAVYFVLGLFFIMRIKNFKSLAV
ncbi:MAG: MFS transporter [Bacteroidota bacterium]